MKKDKTIYATFVKTKSGKQIAITNIDGKDYVFDIINTNNNALNKDSVLILKINQNLAQLKQITKRYRKKIAGYIVFKNKKTLFKSTDPNVDNLFKIKNLTKELKQDTLYEAEIIYPKSIKKPLKVKITKYLGPKYDHEAIQKSILVNHNFYTDFPEDVKKDAIKIKENWYKGVYKKDEKNRINFEDTLTFTIDPENAKDFDDAISVKKIEENVFEIGIHIADVSFFVKTNSNIDKEAQKRATSIYLVDRTIHMLPEELSADVCSLVPEKKRFAFSIIFEIEIKNENKIEIRKFKIAPTIIKSDYRLTYKQAQEILDTEKRNDKNLTNAIDVIDKIATILKKERIENNSLEFNTQELEFILDENKKPVKIKVKKMYKTNSIIEELMLLANRVVAKWFSENSNDFFVFRIHDQPNHEKIKELNMFLNTYGLGTNKNTKEFNQKQISEIIRKAKDTEIEALVNSHIIRSLAKAQYHFKNIGHFSLSFDYYTHFTSPIRRYPDIMVHRLAKAKLNKTKLSKYELDLYKKLTKHTTEKEIEAMQAERDSIKQKQIEFFQDKIGQEFEGVVSGIIKSGIFITEKNTLTEGFAHIKSLSGYFEFDEKNYTLKSKDNDIEYRIGQKVKIKLKEIDKDIQTIRWEVIVS